MKVKALLSFFVSIFCILYTYAEKVDLEKAEKVARSYVSSTPRLHTRQHIQFSRTVSKELQPGQPLRSASEEAMYYVFSMDGDEGFIIVSADDIAVPVLGYSEQGSYDENNPNFAYWMECLAQEIAYGIENGISQNEETKALWDKYLDEKNALRSESVLRTIVYPLILKTKWDQTPPYSDLCPNQVYTGCVATAMAQVMKHHNHPETRTIEIPAYTTRTNGWTVSEIPEISYDWAKMTNTYSSSSTQPQKDAVAELMRDCGAAVEMDYTASGSGAYTKDAALALLTYFNYDQSLQYQRRAYHTDAQWNALLQAELSADRPVFYTGSNASSGHAFVCDGYDDDGDYYHFNWGWSGAQDGWYLTTALKPGGGGSGAGAGTYNQGQEILINVKPNNGGEKHYDIKIKAQFNISASKTTLDRGESFTVNAPVSNAGLFNFTGSAGIAIVDASDNILSVIGQKAINLDPGYGYDASFTISCTVPVSTDPGSYTIRVVYKASDAVQWSIATGTPSYDDFIDLMITTNPPQTHGIMIMEDWNIYTGSDLTSSATTVNRGETFTVSARFINGGTTSITGDYGVALVDNNDLILEIIGVSRTNSSLDSGYFWELLTTATCGISSAINPGSYKIRAVFRPTDENWSIIYGQSNSVIDILDINVNATIDPNGSFVRMNSEFTDFTTPINQFSPLSVQVSVLNSSSATSAFVGELELGLYDTSGNSQTTSLEVIGKENASLAVGTARIFTFKLNAVSLPGGTYYMSLYRKGTDGLKNRVDNNGKNNDVQITVIGIPPEIFATSPAHTETDVPISGELILTFDKPMNTTPGVGLVSLGGGIVKNEYKTWSSNDEVCTISYSGLAYSTTYTFNISDFKDASGNAMVPSTSDYWFTTIAPPTTTWDPQNYSTDWTDGDNWTDGVPGTTTKVTLPSNSDSYPVLETNTTISEILFQPGAELGRQDWLNYQKAYVQLDFGTNSTSLSRDRWWMLSNPLQELYAGDFTFGGLPEMAIQRYAPVAPETQGVWTSLKYDDKLEAGDSFALWLTKSDSDNPGVELGLNASKPQKGIITLPYFENPDEVDVHWTHDYSSPTSYFYGWTSPPFARNESFPSYPITVDRTPAAYKLVELPVLTKDLDFGFGVEGHFYYAATGNPFMSSISFEALCDDNDELIVKSYWVWVGAGDDEQIEDPGSYAIYNIDGGTVGYCPSIDGDFDVAYLSDFIPPMQSFIVQSVDGEDEVPPSNTTLTFDITKISATEPNTTGLRASAPSNDLLEIIASTPKAAVRAVIASREKGSPVFNRKDALKLFAGINSLPDIYLLKPAADNRIVKVAADIVNEIEAEWMIPLGIATTYEGPITLSFAGMDTYNARIFLIDTASPDKQEIELTGKAKYEYTFDYKPEIVKGTAVSNENRFFILLAPTVTTGTEPATLSKILVYSNRENTIQALSGEWIQQVSVFNIQGQKIYDNATVNAREHTVTGLVPGVYAATVVTKNEVKTAKIIVR